MEKEGVVSIWVGNIKNQEEISNYVDITYEEDENGELVPSRFIDDFKVDMDYIDEDFIERVCYEFETDDIRILLKASSYFEVIIPNVCNLVGSELNEKANSKILIYNYEYKGSILRIKGEGYNFKYYGCVSYI